MQRLNIFSCPSTSWHQYRMFVYLMCIWCHWFAWNSFSSKTLPALASPGDGSASPQDTPYTLLCQLLLNSRGVPHKYNRETHWPQGVLKVQRLGMITAPFLPLFEYWVDFFRHFIHRIEGTASLCVQSGLLSHRIITERFGLEGALKLICFQPAAMSRDTSLDQIAPSSSSLAWELLSAVLGFYILVAPVWSHGLNTH